MRIRADYFLRRCCGKICFSCSETYGIRFCEGISDRRARTGGREQRGAAMRSGRASKRKVTWAVRSGDFDPDPGALCPRGMLSAFHQVQAGRLVILETIRPVYLRKSEAERKLEAKESGQEEKDRAAGGHIFWNFLLQTRNHLSSGSGRDAADAASLDRLCFRTPWSLSSLKGT